MNIKVLSKLEEIRKLSIFLGLEKEQLHDIIAYGKIRNYQKNEFLFLEGEQKENFFILLKGLVKLSITDYEGKETIIKISDNGNISDILDNNFSFSCQALEDSDILILSLEKFRNIIKENKTLISNLLFDALKQNHDLINQLATLKLDNSKNRVGQFLLKNSMQNGKKIKNLDLNYNKSQIASYLGIRLETLSRILKQLKDEGEIIVKKNQILLTEEKSLCSYCNEEISSKCVIHNRHSCKYDNNI